MISNDLLLTRRAALRLLVVGGMFAATPVFAGAPLPKVVVNKDPNCGCCQKWAEHLMAAGFPVEVIARTDMQAVKAKLGVPDDLVSCHTATVAGYVIEGHVPASAILRLLEEKPAAIGLSVPGMPAGSPGMEGGTPKVFEVVLFGNDRRSTFGRYKGSNQV
jgi:hypothetical protein